ncbi:MAG TPA: hypothetical protein VF992_04960 [Thermoplasmata archaeon]
MPRKSTVTIVRQSLQELVDQFFSSPHALRTEQSLHCQLYYLLLKHGLNHSHQSGAGFDVSQVQKEYPPRNADKRGRRGRFDLVVFDAADIRSIARWDYSDELKMPIPPTVAIELKLNGGLRWSPDRANLPDIQKELKRLQREENGVRHPFVLYLYRIANLKDARGQVESFKRLEELFVAASMEYRKVSAWLAGTEFDPAQGFKPLTSIEVKVEKGKVARRTHVRN